jgi:hypothetical protein
MSEGISSAISTAGESISSAAANVGNAIEGAKESMNNTLSEFSSQNVVNASSSFLESNSMIAKFVFIILVLCGFVFCLYLGIQIISYFLGPNGTPYVVYGLIQDATQGYTVSNDPTIGKNVSNVPILRSNNQNTGVEFTWSVWILAKSVTINGNKAVFVKGDGSASGTGLFVNNCPGVYLTQPSGSTGFQLKVLIDTIQNAAAASAAASSSTQEIDISNIPIGTWFHLAIRCQNLSIDAYINGIIYKRVTLPAPPRQNSGATQVCPNSGYSGQLSDLRYFNRALPAVDINSIVLSGPNTTPFAGTSGTSTVPTSSQNWNYLSQVFYTH